MTLRAIGLLGGTFDPVHNGHLHIAKHCLDILSLDQMRFIPCKIPPLKPAAVATEEQRCSMLTLALQYECQFTLDPRELERQSESFTVNTMTSLREDYPRDALLWVMGYDAFVQLPKWHRWHQLLDLCHLVVINRADSNVFPDKTLNHFIQENQTQDLQLLSSLSSGKLAFLNIAPYEISSSSIRNTADKISSKWLPAEVADYIKENNLYS